MTRFLRPATPEAASPSSSSASWSLRLRRASSLPFGRFTTSDGEFGSNSGSERVVQGSRSLLPRAAASTAARISSRSRLKSR